MEDLTVLRDLLAVREAIAIQPKSFNMSRWKREGPCGTTFCIGGHLALLRGITFEQTRPLNFFETTGISIHSWLFHFDRWPDSIKVKAASNLVAAAQEAIDLFITGNFTPDQISLAKTEDLTPQIELIQTAKVGA